MLIVFFFLFLNEYKEPSTIFLANDLEHLLTMFFKNDFEILEKMPVFFNCPCSKEHFKRGLISLGKEELTEIASSNITTEIVCHYCGNKYLFSKEEIHNLIKEIEK